MIREALLYETLKDKKVKCDLCGHHCVIKINSRGKCGVRENQDGFLKTLAYGRLIAQHRDPIEKKPLFHLLPGSLSYSIATVGCNFKCLFCQNSDIAHMPINNQGMIMGEYSSPEEIVREAQRSGCKSISYTYTEPTVFFEFAFDTAKLAHENGILNVFVTNGFMSGKALEMISPYLDAVNVDLKSFKEDFYKKYCGAKLRLVKERLLHMRSLGILVEVTTLIIPGLNDNSSEIKELATFLAESLGPETPWHISRFHPTYKLTNRPPTSFNSLLAARKIGLKAGLRYVYIGNVHGKNEENTLCHNCGELLIERFGFTIGNNFIENGLCKYCKTKIYGVNMSG